MSHTSIDGAETILLCTAIIGMWCGSGWLWSNKRRVLATLDSPLKRGAGLCLLIGAALMFVGVVEVSFLSSDIPDFVENWLHSVFFFLTPYHRSYSVFTACGFWVSICALLLSFFYDTTVGKVVKWIMHGMHEDA